MAPGGFHFDPATTLGWSVPMIVLGPLLVFLMIAVGVRGRRAAANLALLAPLVSLVGVLLAGAAGFRQTAPHDGSYQWLNVATAFSGPSQFQNYVFDVGIRVSHLTVVLLLATLAASFAILAWSRAGARGEPSAARYYGLLTLLLGATLGVIGSTDLAELFVFWMIAGVAIYLLLSNSWADEAATRAARLALALPALADMALLAGIGLLYSRYGQLNLDHLIPLLTKTQGAGPKALMAAALLLFAGAAGRIGLFPLQGWLTRAEAVSSGALAAAEGFSSLLVAALLVKVLPLFVAFGRTPLEVVATVAAVSALVLALVALTSPEARRAVTAAGIALSALAILAFAHPFEVAPAAVLLAAVGLARVAAVLATGTLAAGMRTPLLAEMGEGFRRLRVSTLTLPAAAVGLLAGIGIVVAGGVSLSWWWVAIFAAGLALGSLALFRVYFSAGHALLPRRRGFDPNRVRPAPAAMTRAPLLLALLAGALALALASPRWLNFLDHRTHPTPSPELVLAWLAAPVAGLLLAAVLYRFAAGAGRRLSAGGAALWSATLGLGRATVQRRVVEPSLELAELGEERGLRGGEAWIGRLVTDSSRLLALPAPVLPLLVAVAVLVAVAAALLAPGVYR